MNKNFKEGCTTVGSLRHSLMCSIFTRNANCKDITLYLGNIYFLFSSGESDIYLTCSGHLFIYLRLQLPFIFSFPLFLFERRQIDHVLSHKLNQGHFHLVQRLHYILELKKTQRFPCLLFLAFIILSSSNLSEHMCTLIKITEWLKQYIKWQGKFPLDFLLPFEDR